MTIISSDTAFCVSAEVTLFFSNSNRSFVGMITETSGFIFQCLPPFLRVRMESTPVAHGVAPLQEHPELRFQRLLELNLLGQEHIEDTQDDDLLGMVRPVLADHLNVSRLHRADHVGPFNRFRQSKHVCVRVPHSYQNLASILAITRLSEFSAAGVSGLPRPSEG